MTDTSIYAWKLVDQIEKGDRIVEPLPNQVGTVTAIRRINCDMPDCEHAMVAIYFDNSQTPGLTLDREHMLKVLT